MTDPIRLRDEILELLYWLEGEGFTTHATLDGMMRFLAFPLEEVCVALDQLVVRGDVEHSADGTVRLTPIGHREAARRFADDFAPLLRQGHGECNDPSCECHENPDAAAECHARATARPNDSDLMG
jgi:hypothetical protein